MGKNSFYCGWIIGLALLASCADDSDLRLLYDDAKNHKVFEMSATINPMQSEVGIKDTIWISVNVPENDLYDLVSEKNVSIGDAKYICQLELMNVVNPDEVVDATFIIESGQFYEDNSNSSYTTQNGYGFSFGYPTGENLKIGIIPNSFGIYAIWFNNFPNPFQGCKGNNCDQGRGYWYDVFYERDASNGDFLKSDFVDYKFEMNKEGFVPLDIDKSPYLAYSIYPESIYFFKVK